MADLTVVPLDQKICYQASKWLKTQALLDPEEFNDLLDHAGASLYEMCGEISLDQAKLRYKNYVDALKQGCLPEPESFAWCWTRKNEALYLLDTGQGHQVRVKEPIVQISHHQMNYTPEDNTFRSNLYGPDTIFWGLQFSFPQLYLDPDSKEVHKVTDPELFPNLDLYRTLQRWLREHTIPTPFQQVNAPQRIGKKALQWINNHPHLKKKGFSVKT